mmetsp:Transcript_15670/g.26219  ORF Transcript_15670/g.26219 Transcript_15670/m.26219 type:complete len:95 (-) Transcript_15670:1053-1337(-)
MVSIFKVFCKNSIVYGITVDVCCYGVRCICRDVLFRRSGYTHGSNNAFIDEVYLLLIWSMLAKHLQNLTPLSVVGKAVVSVELEEYIDPLVPQM